MKATLTVPRDAGGCGKELCRSGTGGSLLLSPMTDPTSVQRVHTY